MKNILLIVISALVLIAMSGCKLIKDIPRNAVESVADNSEDILDGVVVGLLSGLNDPTSKRNMAEVLEYLADELNYELTRVDFSFLEAEVVGQNLIIGLSEQFATESESINENLNRIIQDVDLSPLFDQLSEERNKEALAELIEVIFETASDNGYHIGDMINDAIRKIDLSPLTDQIEENVDINKMLKPSIDALQLAGTGIGRLGEVIDRGQDKWYRDLASILAAFIIGLLTVRLTEALFSRIKKRNTTPRSQNRTSLLNKFSESELQALATLLGK